MIDRPGSPAHLSRLLQMTPVAASQNDPDNHLAFPMDRDVVWDTPDGERTADRGDVRIREHTPHISGRQGTLFAPQSITAYRNTPERLKAVKKIGDWGVDQSSYDIYPPDPGDYEDEEDMPEDESRFRKGIRHAMSTSRMPTELLRHLPYVEMTYGDDEHFPKGDDDHAGYYSHHDNLIPINHNNAPTEGSADFRNLLLHELGHSVDYKVNEVGSTRNYSTHQIAVTNRQSDPRQEGAAVGFADRYSINSPRENAGTSEDPTAESGYHEFTDSDWGHETGTDIYTKMRRHTRDTGRMPKVGEIDFLPSGKPSHMGEQFTQLKLFED